MAAEIVTFPEGAGPNQILNEVSRLIQSGNVQDMAVCIRTTDERLLTCWSEQTLADCLEMAAIMRIEAENELENQQAEDEDDDE